MTTKKGMPEFCLIVCLFIKKIEEKKYSQPPSLVFKTLLSTKQSTLDIPKIIHSKLALANLKLKTKKLKN
ncbi:hypothetical protein BU993_11990 [Flavobacterium columnare]|nr:hypothetical protein BU993_11990 [Flavobacterium columnare]